ncbi:nitroreductase family protein [Bifidobacterium samirii]|uniref:Nitroreductase n=1 Tax=Bifidobacterium samirii TaxID=2306974 RepID=A0A430FVN2_9BIFI|nr:nitroreductase family protein [Bifidobacterium samirii]RSX57792.1 nitroreductase [Bifidobacterium samirii]
MDIMEAMAARHAVRDYTDEPIGGDVESALTAAIGEANRDGGLHIQLVHDDADAFGGCPTHYGRFKGVRHCIALIGAESDDLDERIGYYGERLALEAVRLGLDTGWVVLHETQEHDGSWDIAPGERMAAAIAVGHGARPGRPHRSKPVDELGAVERPAGVTDAVDAGASAADASAATDATDGLAGAPDWFVRALEAVQLAPSALGKQPYRFTLLEDGRTVRADMLDGVQPAIGLGIARLHFELGAADADFRWQDRPESE